MVLFNDVINDVTVFIFSIINMCSNQITLIIFFFASCSLAFFHVFCFQQHFKAFYYVMRVLNVLVLCHFLWYLWLCLFNLNFPFLSTVFAQFILCFMRAELAGNAKFHRSKNDKFLKNDICLLQNGSLLLAKVHFYEIHLYLFLDLLIAFSRFC